MQVRQDPEQTPQHAEPETLKRRRNFKRKSTVEQFQNTSKNVDWEGIRLKSQAPHVPEETDPFTHRIRKTDLLKRTYIPSHIQSYDGSNDLEDHIKMFQMLVWAEHWDMTIQCHAFWSTLIGPARDWFDNIPLESIRSYHELREMFLKNFLKKKEHIKNTMEICYPKQRRKNQ
ncbi:retrotransposon gag domain-containing protein [Artemisia annua]|uniref:Retrotransposon gag domain-containing protein n=1 Tax=Artemisia annua TaxID=35608 RepID=A0A2U1QKW3_ARTAN|nr:retrotransposon gag domain-containing protein [Artemisia annua]